MRSPRTSIFQYSTVLATMTRQCRTSHDNVHGNCEVGGKTTARSTCRSFQGTSGISTSRPSIRLEEGREAIQAAMAFLQNADALILDMRSNRGSNPGTVVLLASYLFDTPERLLFEIVPREGDSTSYYTASVPGSHRDGRRPVFVLTAAKTFSAGEGLAFILQDHGRAEVVGEVTAGAANPGRPYPIGDYFEIVVPNGRVRSAVSGRNWEGVGVIPDIRTTEVEALKVAHRRALQRLLQTTNDEDWIDTLREQLQRISPP